MSTKTVTPELTRRRVLGGLAGLGALVTGAVVLSTEPPRVIDVVSRFGTVRENSADIETRIVVDNPNSRAIPGGHSIRYAVTLNDVVVATGREEGVRIGPGRTAIETSARFDTTAVPAWWTSHINGDETTKLETRTQIGLFGLPLRISLPTERAEIETDLLGALGEEAASTVALTSREILRVDERYAEWRDATDESSPIAFSARLQNLHDRPITIDGTDYEIRMNEVVVGSGSTDDDVRLVPGESTIFQTEAVIETPRMHRWWTSHLRNEQSTHLHVEVWAVAVDDEGTRRRLPLRIVDRQASFETDMLGTGETIVETIEGAESDGIGEISTVETTSQWGEVRDDETDIRTATTIRNDNDDAISDILTLEIEQETTIAGTTVATGIDRVETVPEGTGTIDLSATKPHSVVPEWWASHLRTGEQSTVRTTSTAEADVAITTLPIELDERENVVETDLLADLNDESTQTVTGDESGRPLFRVHSTSAEWIDPTPEAGPIRVEADVENLQSVELALHEIDYLVEINGVVLADERSPDRHEFTPNERRAIVFEFALDNAQMETWWPTHVRNDERSALERTVRATIDSDVTAERVTLEFLSETVEIETDLLAG